MEGGLSGHDMVALVTMCVPVQNFDARPGTRPGSSIGLLCPPG